MRKTLITIFVMAVIAGCGHSSSTDSDNGNNTNQGGNQTPLVTAAQLSGGSLVYWFGTCSSMASMGAATVNMSYDTTFAFHNDGTYNYTVNVYSDTACGTAGGGTFFTYNMSGNYMMGAAATGVTGATQISFSRSSELLTVYSHSTVGASSWAGYLNSYCTGGATPAFNTTTDSAQDPFGFVCAHSGTAPVFTFPNFPNSNAASYNVVSLNTTASPQTITMSLPADLWFPGNPSYPASASFTLTHQ